MLKRHPRMVVITLLAVIPYVHLFLQYSGVLGAQGRSSLPFWSWIIASGLVAARSFLTALHARTRAERLAWFFLSAASGLWMSGIVFELGAAYWTDAYEYGADWSRFLYFAYPAFLVAGLYALTSGGSRTLGTVHIANLGVIGCAMLINALLVLLEPAIQTEESVFYVIVSVGDMTLLLTAVILALTFLWSADSTNLRTVVLLLGFSAGIHAAVNIGYYYKVLDTGTSGDNLDVFWTIALLLQFWAACEQDWAGTKQAVATPKNSWFTRSANAAQVMLPAALLLGMLALMVLFHKQLTATFAVAAIIPACGFAAFLGLREWAIDRHRKRLTSDLHDSHTLNAHVLRASPGVIFICEARPGFCLTYMSENGRIFFRQDLNSFDFAQHIHPDDQHILRAALKKTLSQGKSSSEFRLLKVPDEWRWINQRLVLKHDTNDHPIEIVGTLVDITERKILQSSLEQTQRLESLGRLSGSIAHDFNNLLTSILGFASLLLSAGKLGPQERKQIEEMQAAGQRGAALTRQLLSFSRRHAFSMEVVNINALVEGMRDMLERLLGDDVTLQFNFSLLPIRVEGSKNQLEQVVMNLVLNASEAMPDGGCVSVNVSEVVANTNTEEEEEENIGRMAVMTVSDEGVGMDDQLREQIFDPFFTTKAEGTGLGLATVHGIVRQHGGHIDVKSSLGGGTSIEIHLPTTLRKEVTRISEQPVRLLAGSERILVVDDEIAITRVIASILKPLGYIVSTANSADEALEVAGREPFDLLLSDIVMPGCNGHELQSKLRDLQPDFKVIYMSGYTNDVLARRDLNDDRTPLLQKPLVVNELAAALRSLLDGKSNEFAKRKQQLLANETH